jgi:Ca-activated chloride channel family protein
LIGVKRSLSLLAPSDRFNVVIFRDRAIFLSPDYLSVTPETINRAREFLTGLKSQGSTDVYNALLPVFQVPTRPGFPALIVFISDGRPSTGSLAGRDLINAISDSNTSRHSIFTFGTGKTVNDYLLDLLAYRNKSESNISTRIEDIESLIPERLKQLNQPYLVNIAGQFNSLNESSIFPKEIPDFYNQKEVILYGRYNPDINNDLTLQLTGESGEQSKTMLLKRNINEGMKGSSAIAQQWANAKVYHLINQISKYGETPELMREIQSLSQQYNLKNAYVIE